ncbi:NAD(P)-binding protein [Massarina eburnea CBS 473.64]|uniref:NAD(P)-binding protein n=1 Tax=Massarina eburnea CBS 473.64 TaxID=1395130 RepID=A0A6A6SIP6_9PLEO|nr:NAD(P)-binding protein [Massarina eburnea CBS 473.64]
MTSIFHNLHNKTILITGANSGIGRSTAFEFARSSPEGLKLVLTARRVDRLDEISRQISAEVGEKVRICVRKLDVSKVEEVSALVEGLDEGFNKDVDVLVNNAAFMSGFERAPDIPLDVIESVWATNVIGVINMTQSVLKGMKKRGKGDIIMIGSNAGRYAYVGGSIYCASEAAVRSFTQSLSKELIATRIRVMTVDPGQVLTEFKDIRHRFDKEKADAVYAGCDPLTPDDVAEIIVFAASRRENVVVADTLLYPSHQASSTDIYRKL